MAERRRFIIGPAERGELVSLDDREASHAVRVLRLEPGRRVEGIDGLGYLYALELCSTARGDVTARVLRKRRLESEGRPEVSVAVGLLKGARMDWVVEKSAELGARRLIPFSSERTVATPGKEGARVGRWKRIACEAMKQSLGALLMEVGCPGTFDNVIEAARSVDLALVGEEGAPPLRLSPSERASARTCLLVFGPEGSFSPREAAALKGAGGRAFSLGPARLRTETAVAAGLAAFRQEWGREIPGKGH